MPAEATDGGRVRARLTRDGRGEVNVATGVPVLDGLLAVLARYGRFDLALEIAPGTADAEVAAAGRALGAALAEPLWAEGARGHGAGVVPADEALAQVAVEASGEPRLVANVDLTAEHVGGLGTDVLATFLRELADEAGLTLHVRLIEGRDTQHVLETIFKGLGVALAEACKRRPEQEER